MTLSHDAAMCFVLGDSPLTQAPAMATPSVSRRWSERPGETLGLPEFPQLAGKISDTSYHEAAHAVVALILGVPVDYVTITPPRNTITAQSASTRSPFRRGRSNKRS